MNVLVVVASRHGSTREIAQRIADTIARAGLHVEVADAATCGDPANADAVVVGSAVYMGRWLKEAAAFISDHRSALSERPVWLFSSGPVGPKTLPEAADIAELRGVIPVRDHRTFDGALDKTKLSFRERMVVKAVKAPDGDFRTWEEIDAWAMSIAAALYAYALVEKPALKPSEAVETPLTTPLAAGTR